ncbi:MAG: FliM/FliN family flagellar motor switch protein [Alphaproteobacteria bacterium]|nr:FliM/FliN family flagellar motor switch protein [Alphaproteobacteria bacterium]
MEVAPIKAASTDSAVGVPAALDFLERGRRRILEAALDADLQSEAFSDGDRKLLELYSQRIARDLADELDALMKGQDESAARYIVSSAIALDGQEVLQLSLPDHALAPLVKSQMTKRRDDKLPLVRRSEALKRIKVTANGILGSTELSLEELQGVSVGDVLVLDRGLGEPVEIRLPGGRAALLRGKLCRSAGQISIQL